MTRRLIAAFVLGGLCLGTPAGVHYNNRMNRELARGFDLCVEDMDELATRCNERIEDEEMWVQRYFCSLRMAEELLQPLYPEWRGYFAERDRRQYDEEFGCEDIVPHEWTAEEIRDILLQVALYCGIPAAIEGHRVALDVLRERGAA